MITVNINRIVPICIARHADAGVEQVVIDVTAWRESYPALTKYRIEVTSPDGVIYIPRTELTRDKLVWLVTAHDTAAAGNGLYQVVAEGDNGERKTSGYDTFAVNETMPGTAGDVPPDPAKPWVDKVMDAAQGVMDAVVHSPIIGENGNWLLWSFEESAYVDSGVKASGEGGGSGIAKETDPTVPAWAKQPEKPTYTAEEVGAQPKGDYASRGDIDRLTEEIAENKTALENITVEGFRRIGGYENVKDKAELHAGKFVSTGDWDSSAKKTKIKFFDGAAFNVHALTVAEGERYKIKTWCGGSLYGCFLVNAAEYIIADYPKPKPSVADNYEIEFTVPAGVTTLYVNETVSQAEKFAVEKENLSVPMFEKIDDHLYEKKLACVGDSITEATNPDGGYFKNYAELAAERHNMTVYKDGKGGSTMANIESNIPPFSAARYLNVPSDFDILTIWFGWNDSAYATVGTIDDTEDTTFYGAYKKVLDYFITTYPTKKIGLIVPYGDASVEPFRVAVRALSEMYGVPCLDLADGKRCSLLWGMANEAQLARRAALTYDGTHPNQVGHEYLSTMYEEFIKRL